MPKIVDHDRRRQEIISAAWRLIAADGVAAVTTRRISEETGYSNGLLNYYFPGKDSVVSAALQYVFEATNARAAAHGPLRGLDRLRALALEILPLDEFRVLETRLAISFWQHSLTSEPDLEFGAERMGEWRATMIECLTEAHEDGTLRPDIEPDDIATDLLSLLMGAQVLSLMPDQYPPEVLIRQLDRFLSSLT